MVHKPIKITLRRTEPKPELEDFVQRVRLGAASEEEAETEESSEQLVRLPPRKGRERWVRGLAPPVDRTQQRAQGPPPVAGTEAVPEPTPREAVPEPVFPDLRELVLFGFQRTGHSGEEE